MYAVSWARYISVDLSFLDSMMIMLVANLDVVSHDSCHIVQSAYPLSSLVSPCRLPGVAVASRAAVLRL